MSISHFGLNNMVLIIDNNGFQLDGPTSEVMNIAPLEDRLTSFGFDVETVNGHSISNLLDALSRKSQKPRAIVANTTKANGISFLVNNKMSHQCVLTKKKLEKAIEDINNEYNGK